MRLLILLVFLSGCAKPIPLDKAAEDIIGAIPMGAAKKAKGSGSQ